MDTEEILNELIAAFKDFIAQELLNNRDAAGVSASELLKKFEEWEMVNMFNSEAIPQNKFRVFLHKYLKPILDEIRRIVEEVGNQMGDFGDAIETINNYIDNSILELRNEMIEYIDGIRNELFEHVENMFAHSDIFVKLIQSMYDKIKNPVCGSHPISGATMAMELNKPTAADGSKTLYDCLDFTGVNGTVRSTRYTFSLPSEAVPGQIFITRFKNWTATTGGDNLHVEVMFDTPFKIIDGVDILPDGSASIDLEADWDAVMTVLVAPDYELIVNLGLYYKQAALPTPSIYKFVNILQKQIQMARVAPMGAGNADVAILFHPGANISIYDEASSPAFKTVATNAPSDNKWQDAVYIAGQGLYCIGNKGVWRINSIYTATKISDVQGLNMAVRKPGSDIVYLTCAQYKENDYQPKNRPIYRLSNGTVSETNITGGNWLAAAGTDNKVYFSNPYTEMIMRADDDGVIREVSTTMKVFTHSMQGQDGKMYFASINQQNIDFQGVWRHEANGNFVQTTLNDNSVFFTGFAGGKLFFSTMNEGGSATNDTTLYYLDDDGDIKPTNIDSAVYAGVIEHQGVFYFTGIGYSGSGKSMAYGDNLNNLQQVVDSNNTLSIANAQFQYDKKTIAIGQDGKVYVAYLDSNYRATTGVIENNTLKKVVNYGYLYFLPLNNKLYAYTNNIMVNNGFYALKKETI